MVRADYLPPLALSAGYSYYGTLKLKGYADDEMCIRESSHYTGSTTPFVRLWISYLTDKAIREGLRNLEDGSKYDNLYLAAKARSERCV